MTGCFCVSRLRGAAMGVGAEAAFARVGLPVRPPEGLDRRALWEVVARDKKAASEGVRFVVLDDVAAPVVVTPGRSDVDAVLDELAG
jgi:3-dehydroquinate synthetase